MTKEAALHSFWSSFQLPAYEENSIYAMKGSPVYPFITYEIQTDSFGGGPVNLTASLWYRPENESWNEPNAKKREISAVIGMGGICLPCDGGAIWLKRGSPFAQNMGDSSDDYIKRVVLNVSVEFFTEN